MAKYSGYTIAGTYRQAEITVGESRASVAALLETASYAHPEYAGAEDVLQVDLLGDASGTIKYSGSAEDDAVELETGQEKVFPLAGGLTKVFLEVDSGTETITVGIWYSK